MNSSNEPATQPMADQHHSKAADTRLQHICTRAETERMRVFQQDILRQRPVQLQPLEESTAGRQLTEFAAELWRYPGMHSYFDGRHFANLREHVSEAQHGFLTLIEGGILEIVSIPAMPAEVMGFQFFIVYDPKDERDLGRFIGYTVWSLEKGRAAFDRADAVRMAFDIFPPFREGCYKKVAFSNHEIYNISRYLLYRFRPSRYLVDARTQIRQTRTGVRHKRAIYYLKRGYYPPDQKALADACLDRLVRGQNVSARAVERLLKASSDVFWIYPVARYVKSAWLASKRT